MTLPRRDDEQQTPPVLGWPCETKSDKPRYDVAHRLVECLRTRGHQKRIFGVPLEVEFESEGNRLVLARMEQMTAEGIVVAGATRWIETDSLKRLVRPIADIPHRIADRGRDSGRRLVVPHA